MNLRAIGKYLGLLVLFLGLNMLVPLVVALLYGEHEATLDFGLAMLSAGLMGAALWLPNRRTTEEVYRKEALAIVGLGWLTMALVGALPFFFYGLAGGEAERPFRAIWDCYFESMSGFTTTGATILTDIESLPRGILFWRSYTHWLGGMGIIVMFVAVLPYLGVGGKQLFRSEVPGPVKEGLKPRIRESAMILWQIYMALTLIETVALMLCGMSLFDALCHTFGTLATGGFSTYNKSIAHFDSVAVDAVIIVFMYLAGVNFSLHFGLIRKGGWREMTGDIEWRWYSGLIVGVSAALLAILWIAGVGGGDGGAPEGFGRSLQLAVFQAVAIMTTTGYATADFNQWPDIARLLLVMIMFIGGMAGSTGGGMKVMRIVTVFKTGVAHLESVFSPRTVRRVRLGGRVIDPELQNSVLSFFVLCIVIFVASALVLAAIGYDMETSITAVIACLFNIGPGLGRVGAVENYAFFDPFSKVWLSLLMVLGRLELYSVLALCVPAFWRSH